MMQGHLFADPQILKSRLILRRKDFESLFDGFTRLKAVSYVVSPDLLVDFIERRGYEALEIVVGENIADAYRQALAQRGADVTQRLAEFVESGVLRIYIPERTVHTKLYLLERPGQCRVIMTSANLTEAARSASRQINYAWYADLPAGHPWLARLEEDYKSHLDGCALFLGDLADLLSRSQDAQRRDLVEGWLRRVPPEDVDLEARKLLQEISRLAAQQSEEAVEPLFSVRLPEFSIARKRMERLLAPLSPMGTQSEMRLSGSGFLRYVQQTHGLPVLQVDRQKEEVRIGIDGVVHVLTAAVPGPETVGQALSHLESYIETVDLGQAPDPRFAKTSMFEALLYMFSAPFADEYMRLKRRRYGAIDSRGPRFLYIYGPSQNGKSTFLRFALKLIAGRLVDPISGSEFCKKRIVNIASVGTAFPLVFDDLVLTTRNALFEEVLKSYWEAWWTEDGISPQIILSSNTYTLKDWAKSRVKRLDFDVQFSPGGPGKEALARAFRTENGIFRWFSFLYFGHLQRAELPLEDELGMARLVFQDLYRHARRSPPAYFPSQPIENLYDAGRKAWQDLLVRLRKARVEWEPDRASVYFSDDMQYFEIREYELCLPPFVKLRRRGKALVIETPREFRAWLEAGKPAARGWLARALRRLADRH